MDTSTALRVLKLDDSLPKKSVVHQAIDLRAGQHPVFLLLYIFVSVFLTSYASAFGCLLLVGPLSFVGSIIYLSSGLHSFYTLRYGNNVWFLSAVLGTIGLAEFACSFCFSGSVLLALAFASLNISKAFAIRSFLSQATSQTYSFAFLRLAMVLIGGSAIVANVVAAKLAFQSFTFWNIVMGVVVWSTGDATGILVGIRRLHLAKTYPPYIDTGTPENRAEVALYTTVILANAINKEGPILTEDQAKNQFRFLSNIIVGILDEWERWGTSPNKLHECIQVALQRAKLTLLTRQIMNYLYCCLLG